MSSYVIIGLGKGTHTVTADNLLELGDNNAWETIKGAQAKANKAEQNAKDYADGLIGNVKPPVDETYADVAALLADQNNQEQDYFYEVTDASGLTAVSSGAAVLLYNASTPTGTEEDYVIIWAENKVYVNNITEIPNRSYNDLQDLPNLYGRELKMIGSDTYQILNSDKDKFLWFVSNNNPQVSTANIFNQEDVIIGAFAGTNGGTFTQDFEKDPADAILEVPEGFTHRVKRNGHFKFKWDGLITGDFVKEYEITASPDGTLWKTGQVDDSGNPVAPTAL